MYKVGKLEIENEALNEKIQKRGLTDTRKNDLTKENEAQGQEAVKKQIKTYSTVTKTAPSDNDPTKDEWTTPKTTKRLETVIRIENMDNPKDVMKTFKQKIMDNKDIRAFKSVKQTKNGTIVVESYDKSQQDKLKTAINNDDKIKFKDNEILDPMFMITGIQKGFSNSEFIEELVRLNYEIEEDLQMSVRDKIKVVTKRQCRNQVKENWILQAPPTITKWFLKKRTIYFDLVTVYVQEHINLAMCFKCSGFDHVAKYCTQQECCYKCSGEHSSVNCTEKDLKCINCIKMKFENVNHSARDTNNCPVYKRRLERFRNNINYDDSFL